jgi:hypothetical protein
METKEVKISTTDPEGGYYVKDEREMLFAYPFIQPVIQEDSLVTGANVHDSRMLVPLMNQLIEKVGKPTALAVDAGLKHHRLPNLGSGLLLQVVL